MHTHRAAARHLGQRGTQLERRPESHAHVDGQVVLGQQREARAVDRLLTEFLGVLLAGLDGGDELDHIVDCPLGNQLLLLLLTTLGRSRTHGAAAWRMQRRRLVRADGATTQLGRLGRSPGALQLQEPR